MRSYRITFTYLPEPRSQNRMESYTRHAAESEAEAIAAFVKSYSLLSTWVTAWPVVTGVFVDGEEFVGPPSTFPREGQDAFRALYGVL